MQRREKLFAEATSAACEAERSEPQDLGVTHTKPGRATILNLKKLGGNKRGAMYGFPVRLEEKYAGRLIKKGIPVIIIKETDRYIGKIKERLPIMKIIKKED